MAAVATAAVLDEVAADVCDLTPTLLPAAFVEVGCRLLDIALNS